MRLSFLIPFCLLGLFAEATAERSVQVVLFKPPANAPKSAFLHAGVEEPFKIDLPRFNFSDSYQLPKGDKDGLVLRFLETALPKDAEMPAGAPFVRIPAAWEKVLLLGFTDPENKVFPVQFQAINANDSQFGVGKTLIVNFTKVIVVGTFGNQNLLLRPNKQNIISDVSGGKTSYQVRLDSITKTKEGSSRAPLIRQVWRHYPDCRQLVYIYTMKDGPVSYQSFPIHNL